MHWAVAIVNPLIVLLLSSSGAVEFSTGALSPPIKAQPHPRPGWTLRTGVVVDGG